MGPTPPGTGVMKLALSLASLYATSPTTFFPFGFVLSDQEGKKTIKALSQKSNTCVSPEVINYDVLFQKLSRILGCESCRV